MSPTATAQILDDGPKPLVDQPIQPLVQPDLSLEQVLQV